MKHMTEPSKFINQILSARSMKHKLHNICRDGFYNLIIWQAQDIDYKGARGRLIRGPFTSFHLALTSFHS
jgi:hypothetical protein